MSTTCWSAPSSAVSAASTCATSLPSGTTTRAPRPPAAPAATACATSVGQSVPGAALQTARGEPAVGQVSEERGRGTVGGPGGLGRAGVVRRWRHRSHGVLLLGGRVPARHGQPQHVGAGAGVALGQVRGERGHLRRQHRLGTDHPPQRRQRPVVVGARHPLEHEAVDVAAREPHLDPHARLRRRRPSTRGRRSRRAGRGGPAARRPAPARPGRRRPPARPRPWRLRVGRTRERTSPGSSSCCSRDSSASIGTGHGDMDTSHRPRARCYSRRAAPAATR